MKRGALVLTVILWAGLVWGQYGYQYVSGGYWFGAQFIGQEGWMVGAKGMVAHTKDGGRTWDAQTAPGFWNYSEVFNPPDLAGVSFVDARHGWAGPWTYPTIGRTTDGGQTWVAESLPGFASISKIAFADTVRGWVIGDDYRGNIIATSNGGGSWVYQDSSHSWLGIHVASPRQCWVVGDSGWTGRTSDGGATWLFRQAYPNVTLYDVSFTDSLYGWACGDSGVVVHTTDGGATWAQQASGTGRELLAIAFLNRKQGFATGDSGTLLRTGDGGTTWAMVATGVTAEFAALSFGDSLHGWIIGEGGTTLETSDRGQTWQVIRQGTTERIQALSFVDDQTGWMSTWEGNIWATQDGGENWSKQTSISPRPLHGIAFANANTGWAVGDSGRILATQNGGAAWAPQASGTQRDLQAIFNSDAQHAWACGYQMEVAGTSNGGQTWSEQFTWPDTTIYDIAFNDSLHGWTLFQEGHLLRTTNRGQTWGMVGKIGEGNWYHLSFTDSLWGWAAGDSGVSRTTDRGKNWTRQNTGVNQRLWDVDGASRQRAWAVGDSGKIIVTSDGGTTWSLQTSPVTTTWRGVAFADSLRGVAAGDGYIINTTDGGATWVQRYSGGNYYAATLVDSLEGWAVGDGERILHTTDGGITWQQVHSGSDTLRSVIFINRDEGWVGGGNNPPSSQLLHTADRGATWINIAPMGSSSIFGLCFADSFHGWMGGRNHTYRFGNPGLMMATTDGGQSWQAWQTVGYPKMYATAGQAVSSRESQVCGSNGLLLRTLDGTSWERVNSPTSYSLWETSFGDEQTGWAVGRAGIRIGTTNQGYSWQIQKVDSSYSYTISLDSLLMSVQAFDGLTARAMGYLGRSALTTDGGNTWVPEQKGTWEWLLASSFLTPTLGWVAGENGMVLKYGRLPFGVEENKGNAVIPYLTSLEQNRPNPFREGTEIRYQLATKGKVRLVVYNVLGQTVRKLVDRDKEPGIYGASWDGRDEAGRTVSSGIYFYRLESSGKSLTRKMVRVR